MAKADEKPVEQVKAPESPKEVEDKKDEAKIDEQPKQAEDDKLDIQDGKRLDQNVKAAEFDEKEEKKAAYAKAPEVPEHVKHAIKNPNGAGVEWPRV